MGLMDAIGAGIGQAAEGLAASSMEQIKAQIDTDRQAALMQMKAASDLENAPKMEAARLDVQSKAADVERGKVGLISTKAVEGIDPNDTLKVLNAQADALQKAGHTEKAKDIYNRIDKLGDNKLAESYRAWQMDMGNKTFEETKKQNAAQLNMEKQKMGQQYEKLKLDKQEKAEAKNAMSAYMTAAGNFSMLDPKATDPATYKAATVAKELAALDLLKFGVKVGGATEGSFHASVVDDPSGMGKLVAVTNQKTGDVKAHSAEQLKQQAESGGKTQSAPQAAIDYLAKNPNQKAAFKAKYGYLPGE